MATAGIASEASIICSSAATSTPMRQARPVIRRENISRSRPCESGDPTTDVRFAPTGGSSKRSPDGATLILYPDDHAFVAAQIERAPAFLSLPVQERRKQNFAADADCLRHQRNRLGSEVQRDHDRRPFA